MALVDRVRQGSKGPGTGLPCSVGTLLDQLPEPEADALREMLGTPEDWGWPASSIYDALRDEGYRVGAQTINRHRGRKCKCFA